jgi:histidinol-phosphate aminotransferase
MKALRLTKTVQDLPHVVPFVGPEALERQTGVTFQARLGANENGFGPSPKSVAAMQAAAADNWMYGDPENHDLRQALAHHHDVPPAAVMVGEGIDGLLGLTVRLLVEVGETVVTTDGAYPTFNAHVTSHGGRLVKVPMSQDHEDLAALVATAREQKARLLYVSNPNNPMGTFWSGQAIENLIASLPDDLGLLLDEAYCDTAPQGTVPPLDPNNPQVLRFRTFSKAYGLAGARIGYVIAHHDLIAAFDKVRNHYGINRVGQIGALAALKDQDYLRDVVARLARSRQQLFNIANAHGFPALPSGANFVAIDCGEGAQKSAFILEHCLKAGVFIRRPSVAPLDRCIRVSCGDDNENALFAAALGDAVAAWQSR